jgi:hypothetical protein
MRIPDNRRRPGIRSADVAYSRERGRKVARDRMPGADLAEIINAGPPETEVGRHNFATIEHAIESLGLLPVHYRTASHLIREIAEDSRDLLSVAKAAREAGIPQPVAAELIRRGIDLRRRFEIEGVISKAEKPPAGFQPIPGGKKGGYRKKVGGKFEYWYPDGKGPRGQASAEEGTGRPSSAEPGPAKQGAGPELRNGKTAGQRFEAIKKQAAAAGKRITGDFDEGRHTHEHMDRLENQLKEHIGSGLGTEGDSQRAAADRHAKVTAAARKLGRGMREKRKFIGERVWHGVKHTAAEFPVAAKAMGKFLDGEQLNRHEMEAIVSVGAMIGTTAIVASGYGAAAGGAVLSQKFLTHVAMAALSSTLNTMYTGYAALGFVKKLAAAAEGYAHGGIPGAAYHAAESAVHKAEKPEVSERDEAEVKKLSQRMVAEMANVLDHEWTPEEIEAAENGGDMAAPEAEEGPEGEDAAPEAEADEAGPEEAAEAPESEDAPEPAGDDDKQGQTQETLGLLDKLSEVEDKLTSPHQKGMHGELMKEVAAAANNPSAATIAKLTQKVESFISLVSALSGDTNTDDDSEDTEVEKAALMLTSDGRLVLRKAGGWQNIPGGKHGGQRKREGGHWIYRYPSRAHHAEAVAHHEERRDHWAGKVSGHRKYGVSAITRKQQEGERAMHDTQKRIHEHIRHKRGKATVEYEDDASRATKHGPQQSPAFGKLAQMADEHPEEVSRIKDWVQELLEANALSPRAKASEAMTYNEVADKLDRKGAQIHPHDLEFVLDSVMAKDPDLKAAGFRTRGSGANQRYFMIKGAIQAAPPMVGATRGIMKAESYSVPEAARNNARKVLEWKKKYGSEVKGMTSVGWARARQLAGNATVGLDTVKRMAAFNRHRSNAEVAAEHKGEPWKDRGYVAWLGWGGSTGVDWARRITGALDKAEEDLEDACWAGYEAVGMKQQGGRKVPNCVPVSKAEARDATDARGSAIETPADDPEEPIYVRPVGFRPPLAKGGPPQGGGWQPIPGGKKGGYRKRSGTGYSYWYPGGADGRPARHEHHEILDEYNMEIVAGADGHLSSEDVKRAVDIARKVKEGITASADVCKLSPPVCQGNMGIPRSNMPQILEKPVKEMLASDDPEDRMKARAAIAVGADPESDESPFDQLLNRLKSEGVKIKNTSVPVGQLKATQREIKAGKTYGMADAYLKGKFRPQDAQILISSDGHILDGHHRYASLLTADPTAKMKVTQVGVTMREFLQESFKQPGVFRADLQGEIVDPSTPLNLSGREEMPEDAKPPANFQPAPQAAAAKSMRPVPPPPPPRFGMRKARAPHPVNEHGHRDKLEPGMLLHPRERHAERGTIEVLTDGRFRVGDNVVKGGHALLTDLYGSADHRMTVRRYFKLGGERQAIARRDVVEPLRRMLKSEGVVVQRAGEDYHLTGDLRKAGIPDYMLTTGPLTAMLDRETAYELFRLLKEQA